jgi:hypothetical protein
MEIESCEIKTNEGERFLNSNLWISCQNPHFPKSCGMKDKSKPQIEKVDFHLKCCIEAGVSEITLSGSSSLGKVWSGLNPQ